MDTVPARDVSADRRQRPLSRRWLLGASGAALLAAGCTQHGDGGGGESDSDIKTAAQSGGAPGRPAPDGILGVNFNEDPSTMNLGQLKELNADWVRGFVPMPEIDKTAPARQRAIRTLLAAHKEGHGTLLSLKFPYNDRSLPAPKSSAMKDELARLDKVLDAVMGTVDVLTIANEPFIESLKKDQDSGRLNAFYEAIAHHVIAHRKKKSAERRTHLYMGALNFLDDPKQRTEATERWLKFAHDTPEIAGVDIHPHVADPADSAKYVDYVLPRLRHDQKFLATEFSLVRLWKQHLGDTIPDRFAHRHHLNPDTKVWQVLKDAAKHPFPQEKWRDFLSMNPWFEDHKHYLRNQTQRFRDTGRLAVATYGIAQAPAMVHNFGPTTDPWLLNSLYSNLTVQPGKGGKPAHSYSWFDDFRALQHPSQGGKAR